MPDPHDPPKTGTLTGKGPQSKKPKRPKKPNKPTARVGDPLDPIKTGKALPGQ